MCEGYGSYSVCLTACVSATKLAATYFIYVESRVPLGFLCCSKHMYCVDFVENACLKVLEGFADHLCLLCFLMNSQQTKEIAIASFPED